MWDLHAARQLALRLVAAGVPAADVRVRGRRVADGLQEAQARPRSGLTTRWRRNLLLALVGAVVVGLPVGATTAMVLLGEHEVVAGAGAALGCVGVATTAARAVWADHTQRRPGSRSDTRVEGHVCVSGGGGLARAELLLTATPEVRGVERLLPGRDPLAW
jgi:hypothetical protein